jgi:hypothetical protein
MESSHDGVAKHLNGHGSAADGASTSEPQRPQLPGLVDELAHAMGMARDALERAPAAALSAPAPTLPAMPPPRHLFDDEDDDAAMPIPSTWRSPPEPPPSSTLHDQLRAAALGFGTGLAVILPLVLLLTGRLGDLSLGSLGNRLPGSSVVSQEAARATALPTAVQQRSVATSVVVPSTELPALRAAEPAAAPVSTVLPSPASEISWTSVIAEGRRRIRSGDIAAGRNLLTRPVAANNAEAILALAETYDPNMLAAWGIMDASADVAIARQLYTKALDAGLEPARARLKGLE